MSGTDMADWTTGEEAIVYQSCAGCGSLQYFRRSFCAVCGAPDPVEKRASGAGTVVTRVYGVNRAELAAQAGRLSAVIARIPGVTGTTVTTPVTQPTIDISVNLDAAARNGISPGEVRREAGTLLSGLTVGNYFENQAVFDVVVWGLPATRSSLTSIDNLLIDTTNGGHVRLGQVATVGVQPQPSDIPQEAMSQYADVTATVSGGAAGSVRGAISAKLAGMAFPTNYHAELVGPTQYGNVLAGSAAGNQLSPNGSYAGGTSRVAFIGYVIAALVAVLLIAQAITGSWRLGLTSFLVLPACLSGAVLVTFATGQQDTLAAAAGLLAVYALAARLVIGTAARLRGRAVTTSTARDTAAAASPEVNLGSPALTAVPLLITAVTLVPFVVMGDVPGMELLHTAAAVILGGLATTLLVCLVVLPVASRLIGPGPALESDDTLAGITIAGDADVAGGVTVPATRQPADAMHGHRAGAGAANMEHALVRDNSAGRGDGPPHRPSATDAGPPSDTQPGDTSGFREDA